MKDGDSGWVLVVGLPFLLSIVLEYLSVLLDLADQPRHIVSFQQFLNLESINTLIENQLVAILLKDVITKKCFFA